MGTVTRLISEVDKSMARHPAGKRRGKNKFPEVVSAVSVTEPVDATPKRRPRADKGVTRGKRADTHLHLVVDPQVMQAARQVRRPGEKLVIVSSTEVKLVPKSS
jgi:hypothetical protein